MPACIRIDRRPVSDPCRVRDAAVWDWSARWESALVEGIGVDYLTYSSPSLVTRTVPPGYCSSPQSTRRISSVRPTAIAMPIPI